MATISLFVLPPASPHAPSAAVPYLAGHLVAAGHCVRVFDLNAQVLRHHTPDTIVERLMSPIRTSGDVLLMTSAEQSLARLCESALGQPDRSLATSWDDIARRASAITPAIVEQMAETVSREFASSQGIIGLSCIDQEQLAVALALARETKKGTPEAIVVVGGPILTTCMRYFGDEAPFDAFDYIVVNDGAKTFERLLRAIESGEPTLLDHVAFLGRPRVPVALKSIGLASGSPAPPMFPASVLSGILAPRPVLPVFSAQGCSYGECNFCSSQRAVTPYRPSPMRWIVGEMDRLNATTGATDFDIVDNNFDPKRIRALVNALGDGERAYRWKATARFYEEFTTEFFEQAVRAGCGLLCLGLESYDDGALAAMKKGYTTATVDRVLGAARSAGLPIHLYAIVGHPSESGESRNATLEYLRDQQESFASVYLQTYDANLSSGVFVSLSAVGAPLDPVPGLAEKLLASFPDFDIYPDEGGVLIRRQGYPRCEELFFLALSGAAVATTQTDLPGALRS